MDQIRADLNRAIVEAPFGFIPRVNEISVKNAFRKQKSKGNLARHILITNLIHLHGMQTHYVLRITYYALRITHYSLLITHHVPCE